MCVCACETLFTTQKSLFWSGSAPDSPLDVDAELLRHRKRDADCSFIMCMLHNKEMLCVFVCVQRECVFHSLVRVQPVPNDTSMDTTRVYGRVADAFELLQKRSRKSRKIVRANLESKLTESLHRRCPFAALLVRIRKILMTSDLGESPKQSHDR